MTESGYYEIEGHKGYQPKEEPMGKFEYEIGTEYKTSTGYTAVILGEVGGRLIGYRILNGCLPIPDHWSTDGSNFKGNQLMIPAKVIWVNEYKNGDISHDTEQAARNGAGSNPTRIAVRYVEAPKESE